jgi:hypothetical protein
LVGCGPSDSAKQQEASQTDPAVAAEVKLLSDPSKAGPELIRRIRASVKMRDGLVVVDPLFTPGIYVIPANSSWAVNCGNGITAIFGNSGSGRADGSDADVKVWLAYAPLSKPECETLALIVGREIRAILDGG